MLTIADTHENEANGFRTKTKFASLTICVAVKVGSRGHSKHYVTMLYRKLKSSLAQWSFKSYILFGSMI